MAWTDDRVAILTKMWEGGSTATEIAKVLDVTRNAVIGKAHRLGLSGRPSPIKKKKAAPAAAKAKPKAKAKAKPKAKEAEKKAEPKPKAAAKTAAKPKAKAKPVAEKEEQITVAPRIEEPVVPVDPNKKGLTLMELTERTCRWPYGDPQELENFYFCGAQCDPEVSYCARHAAMAYQQPNQKKDDAAKKAAAQAEARKRQEAAKKKAGGKGA